MKEENFDELASELEQKLGQQKEETPASAPAEEPKNDAGLMKALMVAAKDYFGKAQSSDLKAEKDKRGSLIDSSDDPAKSPKKSGAGYPDSSKYEARKGHEDEDEDEEEEEMPKHFKKKSHKKKMKKSYDEVDENEEGEEGEDEVIDATEVLEDLQKSVQLIEEGMATFGELLTAMADPRREKNEALILKALTSIIDRQDKIEKSLAEVQPLVKAMSSLPGVPKAVQSMTLNKSETTEGTGEQSGLSPEDKNRLFNAAVKGKISKSEMKKAIDTNDASILQKIK